MYLGIIILVAFSKPYWPVACFHGYNQFLSPLECFCRLRFADITLWRFQPRWSMEWNPNCSRCSYFNNMQELLSMQVILHIWYCQSELGHIMLMSKCLLIVLTCVSACVFFLSAHIYKFPICLNPSFLTVNFSDLKDDIVTFCCGLPSKLFHSGNMLYIIHWDFSSLRAFVCVFIWIYLWF